MRFMTRGLMGLGLLVLTVGLLLVAGDLFFQAIQKKQAQSNRQRPVQERTYTVEVAPVRLQTVAPVIDTYGEVISGRTLEIRAAAGGELVKLNPDFRDGGTVKSGDLLFQTDPSAASAALKLLQSDLAEAEAQLAEARDALVLAQDELAAADRQAALRQQALERQQSLKARGVGTDAAIESAELAVSTAQQTLLGKRQALADAKAKISRTEALVSQTRINVDEAARKLRDTSVYAGFDGVLSDVSVVQGGLVNANEQVGKLIDPRALEVLFRISSAEFARLNEPTAGLDGADVLVSFSGLPEPVHGKVARVSAAVGEGQTGRELYASLDPATGATLRPGDFVGVRIREPDLSNVAVLPVSAVTTAGEVLLVGADSRLEAATVQILRRQGDTVIVRADDIVGRQLVLKRAPQLGVGIRVQPRSADGTPLGDKAEAQAQPEMITLSEAERDRLIAAIKGSADMAEEAKTRLVERLTAPQVSKATYDRINARVGG